MAERWHLQDAGNYEEFYLRPPQSGSPDANQYSPVFHGLTSWQLWTQVPSLPPHVFSDSPTILIRVPPVSASSPNCEAVTVPL